MMDFYMVGMWLCHIPTFHHYDIFPPGGNMTGGNMLVGHHHHHLNRKYWIGNAQIYEVDGKILCWSLSLLAKGSAGRRRRRREEERDKGRVGRPLCSLLEINGADFSTRSVGSSRPSSTLASTPLVPTNFSLPFSDNDRKNIWNIR